MKIENLKINSKRIKSLIGAIIVSTNLTACSLVQTNSVADKEVYTSDNSIINDKDVMYLVVIEDNNKKIVPIKNLRLVDSKEQVVEKVNGVIVNDKIMKINNPVEIKFSKDIKEVLIGYDIVPVSEFSLVNGVTGKKIVNIVGIYNVEHEFVDYNNKNLINTSNEESKEEVYEYEELTSEKFYALAEEVYKKYNEIGLDVSKEEVIDFVMMVNMEKITKDNKELKTDIIGNRDYDTVAINASDVYSAINTKNDYNYCSKGLGFDSLILVSDTVFDKEIKDKVIAFEGRIKEIFEARNNEEEFNVLFDKLYNEILTATEDEFNMDYGAGYSCMEILMYFIRSNFESIMNSTNKDYVKYLCSYATEFGTDYYYNSRSYAYYTGIYKLLTDDITCTKTKVK